jgi:hypothetical protein
MHVPFMAIARVAEHGVEDTEVVGAEEQRLRAVRLRGDVVDRSGELDARLAWHAADGTRASRRSEGAAAKRCAVGTKDMSGAWHRTG